MALPPQLGNIKSLKEREAKAFAHEQQWHDQMTDAYEYFSTAA